jgi:hypothetical protein
VAPELTADGLQSVPSQLGVLFVKPDHNIGGYDQILFQPMSVSYKRGRKALGKRDVAALRAALEDGPRERAELAGVPVASAPGPCAMSLTFYVADIELARIASSAGTSSIFLNSMGEVTLIVEIRDSRSGEALLRFAQRRGLPGGRVLGAPRAAVLYRLQETLDIMLADFGAQLLEVIPRARPQPPVSPECKGLFRAMGDAAAVL